MNLTISISLTKSLFHVKTHTYTWQVICKTLQIHFWNYQVHNITAETKITEELDL